MVNESNFKNDCFVFRRNFIKSIFKLTYIKETDPDIGSQKTVSSSKFEFPKSDCNNYHLLLLQMSHFRKPNRMFTHKNSLNIFTQINSALVQVNYNTN